MKRPLQNRVTPFGEIIRSPARGAWLGNRGGCLHDDRRALGKRRWVSRRWICCQLRFKGRRRQVMAPGRYTELFFLDEASAFAAGHRPCAECRRADYRRFLQAWQSAHPRRGGAAKLSADEVDRKLHGERLADNSAKRTFEANLRDLPRGAMVSRSADGADGAWLVADDALYLWAPTGYSGRAALGSETVRVLTPRSTLGAIRAGYAVEIHGSARTTQ